MSNDCPRCAYWRSKGTSYCASCGKNLSQNETDKNDLRSLIPILAVLAVVSIIIVNTVYCTMHFTDICSDSSGLPKKILIPFGLWDVSIYSIETELGTSILFALILIAEGGFLVYASYRFIKSLIKTSETDENKPRTTDGLSATSTFLCAMLTISTGYMLMTMVSGSPPDTSWMSNYSNYQMCYMLSRAGIREELMYRVLWIGLPMCVAALVLHRDRRAWQYFFGGFGMSKLAFVLIVISAIIFGLAHYGGWGWSKVPNAAVAGIFFGYLYVEYGLYAAVLAHTANDTISTISYCMGAGPEVLMILSILILGVVTLILWILKPNMNLIDIRKMETFPKKIDMNLAEQWRRH